MIVREAIRNHLWNEYGCRLKDAPDDLIRVAATVAVHRLIARDIAQGVQGTDIEDFRALERAFSASPRIT